MRIPWLFRRSAASAADADRGGADRGGAAEAPGQKSKTLDEYTAERVALLQAARGVYVGELAALRYSYDSQGRIVMESKDEMRQRGLPSPDRADALMLAFLESAPTARLWT